MTNLSPVTKTASRWLSHQVPTVAPGFVPRPSFPSNDSVPRSYFLGHHRAGLSEMKSLLSSIDVVIECRDYRVPLTSRNPLLEESLAGRRRLVVYTKRDLGSNGAEVDRLVCTWTPLPRLYGR